MKLTVLACVLAAATIVLGVVVSSASADGSGALFGLFPGENNYSALGAPSFNYTDDYLPAMVNWQGRKNDVINVYNQIHGTGGVDTTVDTYLPHIWNDLGSVPMISLNTNNWTNAQVVSGAADADIDYYANKVANFIKGPGTPTGGRRLYIRLDWEMNGNFSPWEPPKNGSTCATLLAKEQEYVQMWRHFHDRFMTTGGLDTTQVKWVFSIYYLDALTAAQTGCANGASNVVEQTYPGDDYVDWVGVDGYAYNASTPYVSPAVTFDGGAKPAFTRLRNITSKPMSVDEVSVSTHGVGSPDNTAANKAQWIADYFTLIQAENVKMSLWFSVNLGAASFHNLSVFCKANNGLVDLYCNGDAQITGTDGKLYNVYSTYKTGVNSPYFISPDPLNPRLLTDAQFAGT